MLRKILNGGLLGLNSLAAVMLAVSTILSTYNAIARSFFSASMPWIEELSCYLVSIMMITMLSVLEYNDQHLSISFLDEKLKNIPIARKIIFWLRGGVTVFFFILISRAGINVFTRNLQINSASPTLKIPYGYMYVIVFILMVLVIVYWAFHFFLKDWGEELK